MKYLNFYYDTENKTLHHESYFDKDYMEKLSELNMIGDDPISFESFMENCLTKNNGTLEIIRASSYCDAMIVAMFKMELEIA